MTAQSANALAGFSAVLVGVGLLILSPSAGFLLVVLGAVCAVPVLAFGPKATRIVGLALLIVSSVIAVTFYSAFRDEQNGIVERAKKNLTPRPPALVHPD